MKLKSNPAAVPLAQGAVLHPAVGRTARSWRHAGVTSDCRGVVDVFVVVFVVVVVEMLLLL